MAQMDAVHFCRFKSNSPGKLIDTVIISFVHESFINVASDSSPGSDDALPGSQPKTRRGCVLLQPVRLRCSTAAACWPISTLGQGQLFALLLASASFDERITKYE